MKYIGKVTRNEGLVEQLTENLEVDSKNIKHIVNWTPSYSKLFVVIIGYFDTGSPVRERS
jgi:hypothetical protein